MASNNSESEYNALPVPPDINIEKQIEGPKETDPNTNTPAPESCSSSNAQTETIPEPPSNSLVQTQGVGVKRRHPARLKKTFSSAQQKEECKHPIVITDLCAVCGIDLRKLQDTAKPSGASVSMIHTVPDLRVSMKEAQEISKIEENRLIKQRKLHLLVDLDQTLIHTTNDRNIPNNLKDVFHFRLAGSPLTYYTRLRPGLREFLEKISQLYELHICTFGSRNYAHSIARHLDPEGKYFYIRILSRDECFNQNSKTANLQELFPNGDHMVCIIDDREDVWNYCANLIHVKPYHFFARTGDINAPPGYAKKDDDDKVGFDFSEGKAKLVAPQDDIKPEPEVVEADSTTVDELLNDEEKINNEAPPQSSSAEASPSHSNQSPTMSGDIADSESFSDEPSSQAQDQSLPLKEDVSGPQATPSQESKASTIEQTAEVEPKIEDPLKTKDPENEDDVKANNDEGASKQPMESVIENNNDSGIGGDKLETKGNDKDDVVNDTDDYLLYLEDILTRVHQEYYAQYDEMVKTGGDQLPHVKNVVPDVRKKILQGTSIVFSGVIPMGTQVESSRAYAVATAFGAQVSDKIVPSESLGHTSSSKDANCIPTTHVVAARLGTAKTNEARRYKGIHIVTPDWLWCCAERWEHVDERLFQLRKKSKIRRHPPAHITNESPVNSEGSLDNLDADSDEIFLEEGEGKTDIKPSTSSGVPGSRRIRTLSGRFMDTINPLLSFSTDEIADMDHEVDDICGLSCSSSSDEVGGKPPPKREKILRRKKSRNSISSHHEFIDEIENPRRSKTGESSSDSSDDEATEPSEEVLRARKRRKLLMPPKTETEPEEEESLFTKFRRGEPLPSDADMLNLTNQSSDDDNVDDGEDNEWMVEALEKELLGGDDNSQSVDGY